MRQTVPRPGAGDILSRASAIRRPERRPPAPGTGDTSPLVETVSRRTPPRNDGPALSGTPLVLDRNQGRMSRNGPIDGARLDAYGTDRGRVVPARPDPIPGCLS